MLWTLSRLTSRAALCSCENCTGCTSRMLKSQLSSRLYCSCARCSQSGQPRLKPWKMRFCRVEHLSLSRAAYIQHYLCSAWTGRHRKQTKFTNMYRAGCLSMTRCRELMMSVAGIALMHHLACHGLRLGVSSPGSHHSACSKSRSMQKQINAKADHRFRAYKSTMTNNATHILHIHVLRSLLRPQAVAVEDEGYRIQGNGRLRAVRLHQLPAERRWMLFSQVCRTADIAQGGM